MKVSALSLLQDLPPPFSLIHKGFYYNRTNLCIKIYIYWTITWEYFPVKYWFLGNNMLEFICTNFISHNLLDSWILAPNLYHRKLQTNLRTWVTHIPKFNNVPFLGSSVKQYTTTNRELWLNTNQKFAKYPFLYLNIEVIYFVPSRSQVSK